MSSDMDVIDCFLHCHLEGVKGLREKIVRLRCWGGIVMDGRKMVREDYGLVIRSYQREVADKSGGGCQCKEMRGRGNQSVL